MSTQPETQLERRPLICVVDDDEGVNQVVSDLLRSRSYQVQSFDSKETFQAWFEQSSTRCDLIVTDINMPGASGYDLCEYVRASVTDVRIPIILVTGNNAKNEKAVGLEAGADDFIPKPFQPRELFAKIESLLKIQNSARNQTEKMGRLTRFLSPAVARMVMSDVPDQLMQPHRADVTVLFADLRRFTAFAERAEPEDVLEVLRRYYKAVGDIALQFNGTVGHLAGDGIMIFFNDPEPIENHQEVAVRAAVAIREALQVERQRWNDRRYNIDFGIGLARGYATIGGIGFDRFWQYTLIGPVTNLAARLCQAANDNQILVSQRFLGRMAEDVCDVQALGPVSLKGIDQSVSVFDIVRLKKCS